MASPGPTSQLDAYDAFMWQLGSYMAAAQFTVYAYDWLLSTSDELEMVEKIGFSWPIAIYFLSRIAIFFYLGLLVIFSSVPIDNCQALLTVLAICVTVGEALTAFLFFLRVRAVYLKSTRITVIFGALWFVGFVIGVLSAALRRAGHILSSEYCADTTTGSFAFAMTPVFVEDTLVFLAISYRLARNAATESSWSALLFSAVTGKGLFKLSRALMQSGQLYYLSVILLFFVNITAMSCLSVRISSNNSLISEYFVIVNIVACIVFRGVALGWIEESPSSSSTRIVAAMQWGP